MNNFTGRHKAVVWQFPFVVSRNVEINMPFQAQILHVGCPENLPCLWALVDPDKATEVVRFRLLETSELVDAADLGKYIGTFHRQDGSFVRHMFLVREKES